MVKLLFQPGEESAMGAQRMVQAGAMNDPRVDFVLGLHVGNLWEEVPLGAVGLAEGPLMAAADTFEFALTAIGGHGAAPNRSPDPVLAAAQTVTQLHTLVSREIDPLVSAVVTVGELRGGSAFNIIPTRVVGRGTVRTLDEATRGLLEERIGEVVEHNARGMRCGHEYRYTRGAAMVQSDPAVVRVVERAARELLGEQGVHRIRRPSMTGEDVSCFLAEAPGCFFALGTHHPEAGFRSLHHSPVFDLDESVLWRGSAVLALSALRLTGREALE